jgi:hypothetical protein
MLLLFILVGLFVLFALIACFAGILFLANRFGGRKGMLVMGGIVLFAVAALIVYAASYRQSTPGRIVRWCGGQGLAAQHVQDDMEDLLRSPLYPQLQSWSTNTMERFRDGNISTVSNLPESNFPFPDAVRLSPSEKPEFIRNRWGETNQWGSEEPQIFILRSAEGQPESIVVAWYMHGLVFGRPGYRLPFEPWYQIQSAPGVYGFAFSK